MKGFEDYKKYKWFYTSSGKLVVGGKNAVQNDELLKKIKALNGHLIIMHTEEPGSPFSAILEEPNKVGKADLEECAIFTACFSKAWKSGKEKAKVDIFSSSYLYKSRDMKTGTWGVAGKIENASVELALVLTKQDGTLRAVPEKSVKNKKEILAKICPGKIPKEDVVPKLAIEFGDDFSQSEILSAIPAGGLRFCRK